MTAEEIIDQYTQWGMRNIRDRCYVVEYSDALKAMEQYRNEGLREELLDYSKRYVFLPYPAQNGTHENLVDEYLKQKP